MDKQGIKEMASETVLYYIHNWGQGLVTRVAALNKVAKAVGIDAVFYQENGSQGWRECSEWEAERAAKFRKELRSCARVDKEAELLAVEILITIWLGKRVWKV